MISLVAEVARLWTAQEQTFQSLARSATGNRLTHISKAAGMLEFQSKVSAIELTHKLFSASFASEWRLLFVGAQVKRSQRQTLLRLQHNDVR